MANADEDVVGAVDYAMRTVCGGEHAVEDEDGDGNLGLLPVIGLEPEAIADHALVAAEERLYERAQVVA